MAFLVDISDHNTRYMFRHEQSTNSEMQLKLW
jgi:hypothetical protein